MESIQNVESSVLAFLESSSPLEVTQQTRGILTIISAYRKLYADFMEWHEAFMASGESLDEEAFRQWSPFLDYLEKWLVNSITENINQHPCRGI